MDEDPQLVLAMPRRELFRIQGFVPPNDIAVLESLADEAWFAAPEALASNFDAKEVRLGLIVTRQKEALVSEAGVLLHATPVPPESGQLGTGLAALKHFALAAGKQLLGVQVGRVEMIGFCNEDAMPECRGIFLLVYRMRVADDAAAPTGLAWVPFASLAAMPLDPVSALVVDSLKP
jgi:hypothetical protein